MKKKILCLSFAPFVSFVVKLELLEEYGLELHAEKTRLVYFNKPKGEARRGDGTRIGTFDFPGISHYWGKSYKDNRVEGQRLLIKFD